ncbi:NAD(P)-dependent alcohol dehydrogenase [Sphingobacterium sp. UBA5670]|uniref:NAD(P)-dependent alcohol dehydrogenase n=1 Tax=Sphingobacterium sp. UBA5670 TaxID=1947502 RepID=UPI0025F532C6|nr:NAD(P)-dependent alcohol dehydrogenase [Sphingobacterium sp. UBA5670]
MKVKRLQFDKYGDASQMYIGDYELPGLKPDEVQVKIKAVAINPLDWKQRNGDTKIMMDKHFPKGIGNDFSGTIEAIGTNVVGIKVGDEVFGITEFKRPGAFAQSVITKGNLIVKKPVNISYEEGACLPIPYTTAWAALYLKGNIQQGSKVLINGCSGAVGQAAVQLALAKEAIVVGTCGGSSIEEVKAAGVKTVYDYGKDDVLEVSQEKYDVIFDTSGKINVGKAIKRLNRNGKFIDINPTFSRILKGFFTGKYKMVFATNGLKFLPQIAQYAGEGKIFQKVGNVNAFADVIDAITELESGKRNKGRTVLSFEKN